MRRQIVCVMAVVAVAAFVMVGCKQKAPQTNVPATGIQNPDQGRHAMPIANPHAGMQPMAPAAAARKGKVLSTMNAAGYTYIEVEENGKTLWVAVTETKIKKGDAVEFPDAPPMENFFSKTLNRTFERIILSPVVKVNGEVRAAEGIPGAAMGANPHAGMQPHQ